MAKRTVAREIRNSLKLIKNLEDLSAKEFVKAVDQWREKIILTVMETGDLNPITQDVIKQKIVEVNRQFEQKFEQLLSENQRRLFVKGIQTVDNALKGGGIQSAVPFLSEQKLDALKNYGAEHITALTETARNRIAQEVDLAVLGQKSLQDLVESIGRNLNSPSVFGTLAKRAEVIIKTEVNRINQIAAADRLKQQSEQIKDIRKQWIHSHVGIPRPGHLILDRVVIFADEKFELEGADGRLYLVDGPMDPILPVGEVVNCKCKVIPVVERFQERDATGAAGRTRTPLQMREDMAQDVKQRWENNSREHAVIYNDAGKVQVSKGGSSSQVTFTEREAAKMKNKRLIHNHPSGTSFSAQDLSFAAKYGLKEMLAFGKEYSYSARPKAGSWSAGLEDLSGLTMEMRELEDRFADTFYQMVGEFKKTMSPHDAFLEAQRRVTHDFWMILSQKYGFIYERRKAL